MYVFVIRLSCPLVWHQNRCFKSSHFSNLLIFSLYFERIGYKAQLYYFCVWISMTLKNFRFQKDEFWTVSVKRESMRDRDTRKGKYKGSWFYPQTLKVIRWKGKLPPRIIALSQICLAGPLTKSGTNRSKII